MQFAKYALSTVVETETMVYKLCNIFFHIWYSFEEQGKGLLQSNISQAPYQSHYLEQELSNKFPLQFVVFVCFEVCKLYNSGFITFFY